MCVCSEEKHLHFLHLLGCNFSLSCDVHGRAEMLCKVEEVRREMESRLDSQRRHMVQKESQLKNEVEELKVTRLFNTRRTCAIFEIADTT